jgi:hypothetical protein
VARAAPRWHRRRRHKTCPTVPSLATEYKRVVNEF